MSDNKFNYTTWTIFIVEKVNKENIQLTITQTFSKLK